MWKKAILSKFANFLYYCITCGNYYHFRLAFHTLQHFQPNFAILLLLKGSFREFSFSLVKRIVYNANCLLSHQKFPLNFTQFTLSARNMKRPFDLIIIALSSSRVYTVGFGPGPSQAEVGQRFCHRYPLPTLQCHDRSGPNFSGSCIG